MSWVWIEPTQLSSSNLQYSMCHGDFLCVMVLLLFASKQANGWTDPTKRIISLASRSIISTLLEWKTITLFIMFAVSPILSHVLVKW